MRKSPHRLKPFIKSITTVRSIGPKGITKKNQVWVPKLPLWETMALLFIGLSELILIIDPFTSESYLYQFAHIPFVYYREHRSASTVPSSPFTTHASPSPRLRPRHPRRVGELLCSRRRCPKGVLRPGGHRIRNASRSEYSSSCSPRILQSMGEDLSVANSVNDVKA